MFDPVRVALKSHPRLPAPHAIPDAARAGASLGPSATIEVAEHHWPLQTCWPGWRTEANPFGAWAGVQALPSGWVITRWPHSPLESFPTHELPAQAGWPGTMRSC